MDTQYDVAVGSCGAAAKSSVEIGRIAARMVSAGD